MQYTPYLYYGINGVEYSVPRYCKESKKVRGKTHQSTVPSQAKSDGLELS